MIACFSSDSGDKKMPKTCIILAEPNDFHVQKVLEHHNEETCWDYLVLDTAKALTELKLSLYLDTPSKAWDGALNGTLISDIGSIWYRRPARPSAKHTVLRNELAALAEEEMRTLLHNIYRIVPCRILPHPASDREADYKLLQLKVAASVGMSTPRTVIANHESWVEHFPPSVDVFCIKALSAFHWWTDSTTEYALKSAKVSKSELFKHIKDFTLCPVLLQEYIEKKYEWRVTVIDKKVFACRLDSQSVEAAIEDWRLADPSLIPHEIVRLPIDLTDKLFAYLQHFGLAYGAFDLIEKPDGTYVFLECNPNGQWLWIEHLTGAPISLAIAEYLFYKL